MGVNTLPDQCGMNGTDLFMAVVMKEGSGIRL